MSQLFLLTWNPVELEMDWEEQSRQIADGALAVERWSTGNRKSGMYPGDRLLFLRQVSERGIIAGGVAVTEIYPDKPWKKGKRRVAHYVDIDWREAVPVEDRLPIEDLERIAPGMNWVPQSSGVQIYEPFPSVVWEAWRSHLDEAVPATRETRPAEEIDENEPALEGARTRITVNRYERSAAARRACLEAHGTACTVCGFDFGERYGDLGEGFIHVHHLVDLSTIGKEYKIDGAEDLRPVCANCHAMLHRERPALTLDNLRKRLN